MELKIPFIILKDVSVGPLGDTNSNIVARHIAIEIILNLLIGKSSKLYKKLYETETIMSEPVLEYEYGETYSHIAISGQSKKPKKILEELKKEINKLKEKGISEEDFTRTKNMIYGNTIKEFNNVSDICRMFMSDYFKGINSFEYIEEISNINIETVQSILNEVFKEDRVVISIVKGK